MSNHTLLVVYARAKRAYCVTTAAIAGMTAWAAGVAALSTDAATTRTYPFLVFLTGAIYLAHRFDTINNPILREIFRRMCDTINQERR